VSGELLVENGLVGSVSRCSEIQRAAGPARKHPGKRQGGSKHRGEGPLPERCGIEGKVLVGALVGLVLHLQSALLLPSPHCPLQKGGREEEQCLHLQRGSKGGGGPTGAASSPTSSCPHVVPLAPWGVLLLSQAQAFTKTDVRLLVKGSGKAMTGFYSLFQPNSHTLGLRH